MPRFYFDLRQGDGLISDEEGQELADLCAAEDEAIQTVAEICRGHLEKAAPGNDTVHIEVRDADGRQIVTVTS
jgi:hypothetical protein